VFLVLHDACLAWLIRCFRRGSTDPSPPPTPAYDLQPIDEGTGTPIRCRLDLSCSGGWWHFTGDTPHLGLDTCGDDDCLDTCTIEFYIELIDFYQDMFTLCWKHSNAYACTPGCATILDSDGIDRSTRVYAVSCTWAPTPTSYLFW
jgi:hypothetical protein